MTAGVGEHLSQICFSARQIHPEMVVMQKYQRQSLSQRLQQYQPSKTALFWACAGSVIAATVVGFSWGGWVTGGTAQEMAEDAAAQGRQEVAAVVCVDRFMAAPDAGVQLTALQEMTSSYAQGKFVQEGGWAIIVPAGSAAEHKARADDRKAAGLCAEALAERDTLGPGEAAQIDGARP
jgi:pimeloyl-ACP methyl ester carboxylesterase